MSLIPKQEHYTVIDKAFEARRLRTVPGQAHFAGTGPASATCRECLSWNDCGFTDPGYYSRNGKHHGEIKPRSCNKYKELMGGAIGPAIPHNASACKYFSLNGEPPKITDRS